MEKLIGYWVIGCFIVGAIHADLKNKCPSMEVPSSEIAMAVAVWPTVIPWIIIRKLPEHDDVCKP